MRWQTVELGEVCNFLSGFAFKSELFSPEPIGLPIIRIRDVLPGSSATFYGGDYQSQYIVKKGDILIGMDGEFNRERWKSDPALLNQRVCKAIARDSHLDEAYLYHALPLLLKKIEDETPFVTVKHLSVAKLKSAQIPLPPLEEQRRIAVILDKVASIHKIAGQAEARIGQLEASVFDRYFCIDSAQQASWDTGPLSVFCNLITDGEHQTPERTGAGIKLLSARNIQNGKLDYGKVDFVPEHEFARISRRCAPRRGDILISCSGSIGRVAAYDSEEPIALVRSVALVRPKLDKLRPLFLEFLLRTPRMQALMQRSANASTQANLFQGPIKALQVFSPPLARQDAFADKIGRLRHINSSLVRRVASLKELANSISDHLLQSK